MRAYRERAVLWMRPVIGRICLDWATVSFRSEKELVDQLEAMVAREWGTDDVSVDASTLGRKTWQGESPGTVTVAGKQTAIWGFTTRHPDPTFVRSDDAPSDSLLDEPQAPAVETPAAPRPTT